MKFCWAIVLAILAVTATGEEKRSGKDNYVITLPQALRSTAPSAISVRIERNNVALRIDSTNPQTGQTITGPVSVFPTGNGVVSYRVPFGNLRGRTVRLSFVGFVCEGDVKQCSKAPGRNIFKRSVTLSVLNDPILIFAETNKPIYKPGELVRIRVLPLLTESLRPFQTVEEKQEALMFDLIYLRAPNQMRMAQWTNVSWESALKGDQLTFQLSADPLFGTWEIVSQIGGVTDKETFKVEKYVLPKFTVSVKPPSYVYIGDSTVKFSICAKYTTSRPMKAQVKAKLCLLRKSTRNRRQRPCLTTVKVLNGSKDCAEFVESTKDLQLKNLRLSSRYKTYYAFINATIIEKGTNATISKAQYGGALEKKPFKIVSKLPKIFKMGLPFYGEVQTVNHDGSARPNVRVVCRVGNSGYRTWPWGDSIWGFTETYVSDENGIINVSIPPIPEKPQIFLSVSLNFEAEDNLSSKIVSKKMATRPTDKVFLIHKIQYVFSPSSTFMQIYPLNRMLPQNPCSSGKLTLRLQSNVLLDNKTLHVLTTARGNVQKVISFPPTYTEKVTCQDQNNTGIGHYKCVLQKDGRYKIRCLRGWKGPNCKTPICKDGCLNGLCLSPGKCVCQTGWEGSVCNKCVIRKGCFKGYCRHGLDCECYGMYVGRTCRQRSRFIFKESRIVDHERPQPSSSDLNPIKPVEKDSYDPATQLEDLALFSRQLDIPIPMDLYPSSKIVIWFIHEGKEKKEFVATSITLNNLQDCLNKWTPTSFAFNKKTVRPGERITASIRTSGTQAKCALAISDIALDTFGSRGGLTASTLIADIEAAVAEAQESKSADPYIALMREMCGSPDDREPMVEYSEENTEDSSFFFQDAGVFVVSNIPVLPKSCSDYRWYARYHKASPMMRPEAIRRDRLVMAGPRDAPKFGTASFTSNLSSKVKRKIKARVRSFFPENWKFETLENPKSTLSMKAPDSITTWKSTMYCVSSKGVGLSSPDRLVVFQPFFVQMALPYSLIRGETAKIPVKVFSYRKECSEITLTMKPSQQLKSNGPQQVTTCLCNFDHFTAYFRVQPGQLGKVPVEVEARSRASDQCPNPKGSSPVPELADAVRRKLLVEPEGMPEEISVGDLLCPSGKSMSTILEIPTPSKSGLAIAEGSERAYLMWSGVALGSSLENLDGMVRMPCGCGEQNMITMVPSIYVLDYLTENDDSKKQLMDKARKFIAIGYQRQLRYRLDDGSFSAFGKRDKMGSTWLTAFVFKSFVAAKKYTEIDVQVFTKALSFLLTKMGKNGCFREEGRVIHKEMQGGQGGGKDEAAITAYILGGILEAREADPTLKNATSVAIAAALHCLNATAPKTAAAMAKITNYGVALRAYAMNRWNATHNLTRRFKKELQRRRTTADSFSFWLGNAAEARLKCARPWSRFVSADIETTAYAVLSKLVDSQRRPMTLTEVMPSLRWLASQRNERGGWFSTQDSLLALQALSDFSRKVAGPSKETKLAVTIDSREGSLSVTVTEANKLVLSKVPLTVPNSLKVTAQGSGCLMAQVSVLFNVKDAGRDGAPFALWTNATQRIDRCDRAVVQVCARYTGRSEQSGMAVIKARVASGWKVTKDSLEMLNEKVTEGGLKLIEVDPEKALVLYFDAFTTSNSCLTFTVQRDIEVNGVKPMLIQVYDYYKPHETQEQTVQVIRKECERMQSDSPAPTCPLCTTANDTAMQAIQRLCAKPHVFAAVERISASPMWNYVHRVGDVIMMWNAALKERKGCKCDIDAQAIIAVHTRWWSLGLDEDVTLDSYWTVINLNRLSAEGLTRLKGSCVKKSVGFNFVYSTFQRRKAEAMKRKKMQKAGAAADTNPSPAVEPPEMMCPVCRRHINSEMHKTVSKLIAAMKVTVVRAKEKKVGGQVRWQLQDLKGKPLGSRAVELPQHCPSQCGSVSDKSGGKDLLVMSTVRWKIPLDDEKKSIVPDGSFYIGDFSKMTELFQQLEKK